MDEKKVFERTLISAEFWAFRGEKVKALMDSYLGIGLKSYIQFIMEYVPLYVTKRGFSFDIGYLKFVFI
jgi:hypothetical protein